MYTAVECHKPHEKVEGNTCVCLEGYYRSPKGTCEPKNPVKPIECPPFSVYLNGKCVCSSGYAQKPEGCVKQCPEHSIDNGFGKCVCKTGFYMENGVCKVGKPCPAYSIRDATGKCVCNKGYQYYGDHCSRCPKGQIWIPHEQKCITPCGINEHLDPKTKKCKCKPGFGKYEGICKVCPYHYFIHDGFCVSCPVNSEYDSATRKCVCKNGLTMGAHGFCENKCTGKKVYSETAKKCICVSGLGLSNGECIVCPLGIDPYSKTCITGCKATEVLQGGKCVCKNGFGYNQNGVCIDCSKLHGGFLLDGHCATCPSTFVHNGQTCVCPPGTSNIDGKCIASCDEGQLVD